MMILGIAWIVSAAARDSFFREGMTEIGHRGAFIGGGAFDRNEYPKQGEKHGWAAGPVAGLFPYFGMTPRQR
jgi:hypothetical protein